MSPALYALVGCTVAIVGARFVAAAPFDHLKGYVVGGGTPLPRTALDLDALQDQFDDTGCVIRRRPKLFFVPVTKQNVNPPPAHPQIEGQTLTDDYVCYVLKCPNHGPPTQVSSQFSSDQLTRAGPKLLCVPAVKGPPPTTTTTSTTSSTTTSTVVTGNCTVEEWACCIGYPTATECEDYGGPLGSLPNAADWCIPSGGTWVPGPCTAPACPPVAACCSGITARPSCVHRLYSHAPNGPVTVSTCESLGGSINEGDCP